MATESCFISFKKERKKMKIMKMKSRDLNKFEIEVNIDWESWVSGEADLGSVGAYGRLRTRGIMTESRTHLVGLHLSSVI